ncbi:F-box only protein 27 [Acomys russatus]|uniref:F-box only protein 27 n=1 Tax=Acomys russatus TaxID=60746 RepID=UPI0021E33106|nr:F-box only protein 27 [Acomys russatus]
MASKSSRPRKGAGRGADSSKRGTGTTGTWTSRTRHPTPEPEPQEALELSGLPPELLLLVLSYVPPRTLLKRCRRVCRAWRAMVDGQALWLLLLARDRSATGRALVTLTRRCLPRAHEEVPCPLGRFCARQPLGRNLIRNPCGQEGLQKWVVKHGGDGWAVENNRRPVPGAPAQTCFVTSFRWCRKKQVVDLQENGLWPGLLDSGGVEIVVSDWWGACHDCGCKYRLLVKLLDAHHNVIDKFSATPEPIERWNNDTYHQVTHVFSNIRRGVRFVSFEHRGQDTQFWAGHYGARVTNSSVIVRVRQS